MYLIYIVSSCISVCNRLMICGTKSAICRKRQYLLKFSFVSGQLTVLPYCVRENYYRMNFVALVLVKRLRCRMMLCLEAIPSSRILYAESKLGNFSNRGTRFACSITAFFNTASSDKMHHKGTLHQRNRIHRIGIIGDSFSAR